MNSLQCYIFWFIAWVVVKLYMSKVDPVIHESWKSKLISEFNAPYFFDLKSFILKQKESNTVYPPGQLIFNAFNTTPFESVKVVILGQDPYHGKNQAHGLSFSVPDGVKIPPSLNNMLKELKDDLQIEFPNHGNLTRWANQGVLLLNATLTVNAGQAGSHQKQGWETFTDKVIEVVSNEKEHVVFLLWGNYARAKSTLINASKHLILQAPHPSPFSAHTGFLGCKHFSLTNKYLREHGKTEINWQI